MNRPKRVSVEVAEVGMGRYHMHSPTSRDMVFALVSLNTPNCGGRGRPCVSISLVYRRRGRRVAVQFREAVELDPRLSGNPLYKAALSLHAKHDADWTVRNGNALAKIRKFMRNGRYVVGGVCRRCRNS